MTSVPGYRWIGNNNTEGGNYVGGYPASILLHMTVSMGLSMSYAQSHKYPPHCWANVYTGDKWQSLDLDNSAQALYQPSYTNSYTNRKYYCIQTELVGVPEVSVATYSKGQCDWIAANVVVPQVQALRSIGLDVNLNNVRYHPDTSGSASEYWHGRLSDAEWAVFDGLCAHIDAVGNDHWDCSAERMDWIASESLRLLGGGGVPTPKVPKDDCMIMRNATTGQMFAVGAEGKRPLTGPEWEAWKAGGYNFVDVGAGDINNIPDIQRKIIRSPRDGSVYIVGESGKRHLTAAEYGWQAPTTNAPVWNDGAVDSIPDA